jgi:class 3 adenylate cyclase
MEEYDYKAGKKRIEEILDNKLDVIESSNIPKNESFTFSNAYYGWVTGVFIDIRDSTSLFGKEDKELVSKVIRSFTSESIEILRSDDNLREIGIRGDCVYAIYTTPFRKQIYNVFDKSIYLNTFMEMLNRLLEKRNLPKIKVGIGVSSSKELVIKAGRKGVGINNNVWIGEAVTKASNLSSYGNKDNYNPIVISSITYINIIDTLVEKNGEKAKNWFREYYNLGVGDFYDSDIIKSEFNEWINDEMK